MTREEIAEINPDAILYDGLDKAIIGMAERINLGPIVAYDIEKVIDILINEHSMTYEEAYEYFDFNIIGSYLGENTPVFVKTNIN